MEKVKSILTLLFYNFEKLLTLLIDELLLFLAFFVVNWNKGYSLENELTDIIINKNYITNTAILFASFMVLLPLIWFFWNKPKFFKKNEIGILFAIQTESIEQKQKLLRDICAEVQKITQNNNEYIVKVSFLTSHYINKINTQDIQTQRKAYKTVFELSHANIIIYGKMEERKDNKIEFYNLNFSVVVSHKPLPQYITQQIKFGMDKTFLKSKKIEKDNEFSGFSITSNLLGLGIKFIIGMAHTFSKDYYFGYNLHLDTEQQSRELLHKDSKNITLININKLSFAFIQYEASQLSAITYKTENDFTRSEEWANLALSYNPKQYQSLIQKSILYFHKHDIKNAMKCCQLASYNKDDYTWAYNKAFLLTYTGQLNEAYKIYRYLAEKPIYDISVPTQCSLFIENLLKNEPHKYELYFALALIYWLLIEDITIAIDCFEVFGSSACFEEKYSFQVSYCIKKINQLEA